MTKMTTYEIELMDMMTRVAFPIPCSAIKISAATAIEIENCNEMTSVAITSSSLCGYAPIRDVRVLRTTDFGTRKFGTAFATGSPLLIQKAVNQRNIDCKSKSVSIRCEQSSKGGSDLDVWLGRLAMTGFAAAISIEIGTGKGLLENFGLPTPLPTVALAVTVLVGVLTAVFIFQSASDN